MYNLKNVIKRIFSKMIGSKHNLEIKMIMTLIHVIWCK